MQATRRPGFRRRALSYWARIYRRELEQGQRHPAQRVHPGEQGYSQLRPVISRFTCVPHPPGPEPRPQGRRARGAREPRSPTCPTSTPATCSRAPAHDACRQLEPSSRLRRPPAQIIRPTTRFAPPPLPRASPTARDVSKGRAGPNINNYKHLRQRQRLNPETVDCGARLGGSEAKSPMVCGDPEVTLGATATATTATAAEDPRAGQ